MDKLIPQRIASLREYKGWIQDELAENANIEPSYISKLERGKAPNVSGVILARIATALETTIDYLLGRIDDPSPYPSTDHPLLEDLDFHRLMQCFEAADTQLRHTLIDIAEIALGLPPTRPVLPRTPDEYELPPGCEPDD